MVGGKKQKNYTKSEASISVWQGHAPEFSLVNIDILQYFNTLLTKIQSQ